MQLYHRKSVRDNKRETIASSANHRSTESRSLAVRGRVAMDSPPLYCRTVNGADSFRRQVG